MENDVACRCGAPLVQEGNKMVCSRHCGYEREIIKPVLTQAELLQENERLKETIAQLVKEISHNAPQRS